MSDTFKAADIDSKFDDGQDVTSYFDMTHPVIEDGSTKTRKVNLTLPEWMVERLDATAKNLAISRNAVVNVWLAERITSEEHQASKNVDAAPAPVSSH